MTLAAGRLNKRVTVQQQVTTTDTEGLSDTNWADVATVSAAIEPLSVRELLTAQQIQSNVSVRITVRWRPGWSAPMRIVHGPTIYNIAGVLPDAQSGVEYVTLPASTGLNSG